MDQLSIMMRRFERNGYRNTSGSDGTILNPEGVKVPERLNLMIHPFDVLVEERRA